MVWLAEGSKTTSREQRPDGAGGGVPPGWSVVRVPRDLPRPLRATIVLALGTATLDVVLTGQEAGAVWMSGLLLLASAVLSLARLAVLTAGAVLLYASWGGWAVLSRSSHHWLHLVLLAAFGATACMLAARRERLQRAAAENLENSRRAVAFYEKLLASSRDAIFVVDAHGRVTYGLEHVARVMGVPADPALGDGTMPRLHPEDVSLAGRPAGNGWVQYRVCNDDGSVTWFENSTTAHYTDPDVQGAVVVMRDVTDRNTAMIEHRDLVQRHAQLFDTMGEAVMVHDLDGRIVTANPRFEELFGPPLDAGVRDVAVMLHPEDMAMFVAAYRTVLSSGSGTVDGRLRRADGTYFEARITGTLTDAYGEPAVLDVITDLSGLRELERHSRELATRYRVLVENLTEAVVVHDTEARLVFANPRFEELFGFDAAAQHELVLTDLLHPEDREPGSQVHAAMRERGRAKLDLKMRTRDGTYLEIRCALSRISYEGRELVLAVYSDVTELVRSRQLALDAQQAAERADEAKSLLLSRVSHELRTPISPIIGYADLLRTTRPPSEVKLYAERVLHSGEQLLKIADDLLDFSRTQRDGIALTLAEHALRPLCAQAVTQTRPLAASLGCSVWIEGNDCLVEVDPHRMRQVLVNLITNALRHGRSDVRVRIERDGDLVRCSVIDTGRGISCEDSQRVFEPFVQLPAATGGVGLGLSLVRSLVEAMRGEVELRETPGGGATFCVVLPAGGAGFRT